MWTIEEIPGFEQLPPADQLWLIALAVEENGGPAEYVQSLRSVAERLDELGWWVAADSIPAPPDGVPFRRTLEPPPGARTIRLPRSVVTADPGLPRRPRSCPRPRAGPPGLFGLYSGLTEIVRLWNL